MREEGVSGVWTGAKDVDGSNTYRWSGRNILPKSVLKSMLNDLYVPTDVLSFIKGLSALADLGGGVRDARPPGRQILSISCSFRENLACSRPPWRVHAPPRENPGIRHCSVSFLLMLPLVHGMSQSTTMETASTCTLGRCLAVLTVTCTSLTVTTNTIMFVKSHCN